MNEPLPLGFGLAVDPATRQLDETTLLGGSPSRVMRLSEVGVRAWAELQRGVVRTPAGGALARRLTDAGLAHPRPPQRTQGTERSDPADVTVIVPVRDRPKSLDACLTALGNVHRVLVVDDGSHDPQAVAAVAAAHRVGLIRRSDNGGPGAARNTGLVEVTSEFVALVDSDCLPPADWIDRLLPHLGDPLVAAVAPRIVPATESETTSAGRYGAVKGSLDLGEREARVVPMTRVAYVPTAALLVRRTALLKLAADTPGAVFDPALRYGEDVDLIWRLHEAGWRIRYEPAVAVRHREPQSWKALLGRRFRYGTAVAQLAQRHPDAMAPAVVQPWAAVAAAGLLTGRPVIAAAGLTGSVRTARQTLRRVGVPTPPLLRSARTAVQQTVVGLGPYLAQFAAPVALAALARPGGRNASRRWGRRGAVASLLFGPPLTTWFARRPPLDPIRFIAGHVADDVAYGAGVYVGCARTRTTKALRPRVVRQPVRPTRPAPPDPRGSI